MFNLYLRKADPQLFMKTLFLRASGNFFDLLYSHKALLSLILLLAFSLRIVYVNQPLNDAFSWRESSTAMMAENYYKGNWNIFYPQVSWVGTEKGYQGREFQTVSYTTAILYRIFGQHEWVGRCVVVLFGVWGVFALYKLVSLIWDKKHALAAALIMAIAPGSIFIERSFLPDPAMVSLVTTALWLFVQYLQNGNRKYLFAAAAVGCLGFLTKIPGMIIGLSMLYAAYTILKSKGEWHSRNVRLLVLVALVILFLVGGYYLWARHLSHTYPPYHFAGEGNWIWDRGLLNWIKEKYFLPKMARLSVTSLWGPPVLLLFFMGLFLSPPFTPSNNNTQSSGNNAPYIFHFWLLGFLFFYFLGAREITSNRWNAHIVSPVVAVFSGRALLLIISYNRLRIIGVIKAALIFMTILVSNYYILKKHYIYPISITEYQMGKALQSLKTSGDLVVTLSRVPGDVTPIYSSGSRGWVFPPFGEDMGTTLPDDALSIDDSVNIASIERIRQKGAKWFGIVKRQYEKINERHLEFAAFLDKNYTVVREADKFVILQMSP
jgi:4-amino-4-deoxy-L-arabinose transferase-like glycosyltransferase